MHRSLSRSVVNKPRCRMGHCGVDHTQQRRNAVQRRWKRGLNSTPGLDIDGVEVGLKCFLEFSGCAGWFLAGAW